ncbi:MAG: hypothetical protein R3B97_05490 [Dehalococcoidia bacterium]|nr:hypothetical protein [Dehalococcoidia bacterium]MCB9486796.1 hypothetical protein [Thermoflexaceae bacterium]
MARKTRLSLDEFLAMPGIDEQRLELIDGEVVEKVPPRWGHGRIAFCSHGTWMRSGSYRSNRAR